MFISPSRPFMNSLANLIDRRHVRVFRICKIEIAPPLDQPAARRQHLLWDIDAPGVGRLLPVEIVVLLQRDLAAARQEPVDKDLGGVRMRPALDETHRTAAGRDWQTFLPIHHVHIVHGQTLLLGSIRIAAAEAKGKLSLSEPIRDLAPVPAVNRLLIDEKFS